MSRSEVIVGDSLIAFLNLIQMKDWEMFQYLALSSSTCFKALAATIADCPEFNGMTLLHAVVRFNPPLHLVAKMMEICPEMTTARDGLGRTPLHVAAGCRASPAVIKMVANADPTACDVKDDDGNTPLHFACDSSCVLFEGPRPPQQEPPDHDAICALLSESVYAATIEDNEEVTLQSSASQCLKSQKTQSSSRPSPLPLACLYLIKDQTKSKRVRL